MSQITIEHLRGPSELDEINKAQHCLKVFLPGCGDLQTC